MEEIISPIIIGYGNYAQGTSIQYYVSDNLYFGSVCVFTGFLLFLLEYQFYIQKKQLELEKEAKQAELDLLRLQINPHFLFNALNTIYALAYKKSDKAPPAVLQLSNMMRYMLYEKETMVSLSKELEIIENYIELQGLRLNKPIQLRLNKQGAENKVKIPPYILVTFLENAFKHGVVTDHQFPLTMDVKITETILNFILKNKVGKQLKDKQKGIGLENIKTRLQMIYPNKHSIQIQNKKEVFSVNLSIEYK